MGEEDNLVSNLDKAERLEVFEKHRDSRIARGEKHFDSFWKNTQLVAGGAIAGSLTVLKDLSISLDGKGQAMLKLSWVLLALSITSSLFASFCSAHGTKTEIVDRDRAFETRSEVYDVELSKRTKGFRKGEIVLEYAAPILLLAGLLFMIFALASAPLTPKPEAAKPVTAPGKDSSAGKHEAIGKIKC